MDAKGKNRTVVQLRCHTPISVPKTVIFRLYCKRKGPLVIFSTFDERATSVLHQLQKSGFDSWFVGGCVRDALLGKKFTDYDLATVALPQDTIAIFKEYNIDKSAIPFGCVKINNQGLNLEITTLRQDINPSGRHTDIAFTKDLLKDAHRRDFTINALYWDGKKSSNVIDFFEGMADLFSQKVRFIGDAEVRVQEDFLRILRFFRFSAKYAKSLDTNSAMACEKHQQGLAYLSGTRVWYEWSKTLLEPNAPNVLRQISKSDVDTTLFAEKLNLSMHYQGSSPLLYTKLLLPKTQISHLAHRLHLSKTESTWLNLADSLIANQDFRVLYLAHGTNTYELVYYWAAKFSASATSELNKPFWKVQNPKFPLTGKDLLEQGCLSGPIVGSYLKRTKIWWIQNDFMPEYKECLEYATSLFK